MSKKYKFEADVSDVRLDIFLVNKLPELSRTLIQHCIKSGLIRVNDLHVKASMKINIGDCIDCNIKDKEFNRDISPEHIPLNIVFEDKDIIVIDKPAGLVVHPGSGNRNGTLVNGLLHHCNELSDINFMRPGIIHRLDKNTSGIMVIAKNNNAHFKVSEQFRNRQVKKIYYALAWGRMKEEGSVEGYIRRDTHNRIRFKVSEGNGKFSKTKYYLKNHFGPVSLVELHPETGRTHQLRVHLNSIGHPIFADDDYSGGKNRIKSCHVKYTRDLKRLFKTIDRVALHAKSISFMHPTENEMVSFSAPLPHDFNEAINLFLNE